MCFTYICFRIFLKLTYEKFSALADAFCFEEFYFDRHQRCSKKLDLLYLCKDPYSSLSITVEVNESPLVKMKKVLLIKILVY